MHEELRKVVVEAERMCVRENRVEDWDGLGRVWGRYPEFAITLLENSGKWYVKAYWKNKKNEEGGEDNDK